MAAYETAWAVSLAYHCPSLLSVLADHIEFNEMILEESLMDEIGAWARRAAAAEPTADLIRLLAILEEAILDSRRENMVAAFVGEIPRPDQGGQKFRLMLGPNLTASLGRVDKARGITT